jgi:hypothetical protein
MPMMNGTVRKTCPPDVMAEIANKYSFSFMHDGQKTDYWHEGNTFMFQCPESIRPDINTLIDGIDHLRNSVTVLDDAALMEFLYKYTKMYAKFFRELERNEVYQVSDIQHRTMKFGTGLSDERRGTGRPPSPYLQLTILLINAWESLIAEQYSDDTALAPIITRVPMPKRLDTSDVERKKSKIVSKQPSTEFILTALRMINPNIKDAEVFTAIKKVLKQRKSLQTYIANHPSIYVRRTKLVARSSTREMRVQKKPL